MVCYTPQGGDGREWEADLSLIRAKGHTWNFLHISHFVDRENEDLNEEFQAQGHMFTAELAQIPVAPATQ